jgi:hypothetical protein
MFCAKCGKESADDSQFCNKCGQAMNAPPPLPPKPKQGTAGWKWFVLGILVCIVIIIFIQSSGPKHGISPNPLAQIVAAPRSMPLLNTAISVQAHSYYYDKFVVPPNATAVSVEGHFTATGGLGNDVEVFLTSEDGYVNFQNDHSAEAYYNSGKVTQDSFNVTLPSGGGTYYLIFSNKFSLLSAKAVQVTSTLHYTI